MRKPNVNIKPKKDNINKIKGFIIDNFNTIMKAFFIVVAFGLIILVFVGITINEANKITTGIVVDKYMVTEQHTYHSTKEGGGYYSFTPASYRLCIEGEKDGKTVKYWFEVTMNGYDKYNIGDTYP